MTQLCPESGTIRIESRGNVIGIVNAYGDSVNINGVSLTMTVNELLAELRKLQRSGRGNNPVFLYNETNVPVPHIESVKTFHTTKSGHVVIGASRQYDLD